VARTNNLLSKYSLRCEEIEKMGREILERIDENLLVKLVQDLVRIPSLNPPGNEKGCAEYIFHTLNQWGVKTEMVFDPFPHRPQVIGIIDGKDAGLTLFFNGHMDVVPEGLRNQWKVDPYGGAIEGGRLYGRGSSDMKGGLGAMMMLAKLIHETGLPRGRCVFLFAIGEETGEPGTKHLLFRMGNKGDFGIVLEPTALRVATAEKGLAWFRISLEGRPAHAGVAEQGVNAIEKAVKFGERLLEYNRRLLNRVHPLLGSPKCTMTMIYGGTKENVVPESCSLTVDRRFNPEETLDHMENELRAVLDKLASEDSDFKYRLERKRFFEAAEISVDSPMADILRKHAVQISGVLQEPCGTLFSSDVRNFINDAGIPAVAFGPGETRQAHSYNESIEIQQIVDCVKVLLLTVKELLG
jgi:succinyl-diaminopimelate desuccinylase